MTSQRRLIYRGNPSLASALVALLEREGLTVVWRPPMEQKSFGQTAEAVVQLTLSGVAASSITAASKAALAKFRQRFPGAAEVDEEDDPPTTSP